MFDRKVADPCAQAAASSPVEALFDTLLIIDRSTELGLWGMMTQTVERAPAAFCAAVLSASRVLHSESSLVTILGGLWSHVVTASASRHRQTVRQFWQLPGKLWTSTSELCPKLMRDTGTAQAKHCVHDCFFAPGLTEAGPSPQH